MERNKELKTQKSHNKNTQLWKKIPLQNDQVLWFYYLRKENKFIPF